MQQSWQEDAAENGKWPAEYAHEKFVTWGDDRIAPRNRETAIRWERSSNDVADTFWYIIEGETAVVMYALLEGLESKDGERELVSSSVAEVLSREIAPGSEHDLYAPSRQLRWVNVCVTVPM